MVNPNRYHMEVGRIVVFGFATVGVDTTGLKTAAIDYTDEFSGTPRVWFQPTVSGAGPGRFDTAVVVNRTNTGATLAINVTIAGDQGDEVELHWFAAGNAAAS